jgi:hypothetical protein
MATTVDASSRSRHHHVRPQGGAKMARIDEVRGDPNLVLVSTVEAERLVTLWCGPECTDLTPAAARRLAAYLRTAPGRAERR